MWGTELSLAVSLAKVTVSVCWELHQGRGPATCHAQDGCGRLYNPCMRVDGLRNLCVLRLCNMYVERLATRMCCGYGLLSPCTAGPRVLPGP